MSTRPSLTLTPEEQRIARFMAKQRQDYAERHGIRNARVGPQSDMESNIVGYAAELAFCKLFNVYPDFDIGVYRVGDADRFGQAVDVKATRRPNGRLLAVKRKRELRADVYALIVVNGSTFTFAGFASAAELLAECRLIDLGHGDGFAMTQDELRSTQRDDENPPT